MSRLSLTKNRTQAPIVIFGIINTLIPVPRPAFFLFFFGVLITKTHQHTTPTHHNTGDVRANVCLSNQNAIELLALTSPSKCGPNFLIRI